MRMVDRTSGPAPESCGLPPRSVARCQLVTIDHPIKGQAAFGNIVTTVSAALGSEINKKGNASRFAKPAPGKFTLRS